jgi:copper(I)-binding protein
MRIVVVIASCLLAACAGAPSRKLPTSAIAIDHMVIPAVAEPGGPVAAYAGFDNPGGEDRLLGIECACATSVELHRVVRDGDKVSMTNTFPLALPAGRTEVKPPGIPLHFMLIGTNRPFAVGERVPMRLRFERAGVVEVVFTVAEDSKGGWERWRPD